MLECSHYCLSETCVFFRNFRSWSAIRKLHWLVLQFTTRLKSRGRRRTSMRGLCSHCIWCAERGRLSQSDSCIILSNGFPRTPSTMVDKPACTHLPF